MLAAGDIVHVRSRRYLVDDVIRPPEAGSPLVRLSCLEDDSLGDELQVLWDHEIDARVLGQSGWDHVAKRGFDDPVRFSAFLHTLRWNCVTSTKPALFQAPYRAGIEVKAFQLEPLRKALAMPRVSLFIADDVGVGKTIEAGLVLRELLLRQKVRRVVVACPPSVVPQWREEMEQRFGLTFAILDRSYVTARRQERGFAINPWSTHSRFIISHALLRDETYASPLRDWLAADEGGSLLILDEAHNFAPASGSRYAIDSRLTHVARELCPLFEHKLFLSATPHNGHSNSFSALLEILDPIRFCRGVPAARAALDAVMVRRLKKDLREIESDFPDRKVEPIIIKDLPDDVPELVLSRLLEQYRDAREERLKEATKSQRASAMLVVTSLQKRLLSSIDAFARTLNVHRRAAAARVAPAHEPATLLLLLASPDRDDERASLDEAAVTAEEEVQAAASTRQGGVPAQGELDLLTEMERVAAQARHQPDAKLRFLLDWIRAEMCPNLGHPNAQWNNKRVLIFTEYADTKNWLVRQLSLAIESSDNAGERIATFHGGMGDDAREAVKAAFNADPSADPLRVLIATDAAREGVNLQNHCADLFHFDVPWNPGRMEQRNGRIDRKLQRAKVVYCRYFVLPQRAEDRVLEVLVEKTKVIHEQLGSLPPVIERNLTKLFDGGIRHGQIDLLRSTIKNVDADPGVKVIQEELEPTRGKLAEEEARLRTLLKASKDYLQFEKEPFRDALSVALRLSGAQGLVPDAGERWRIAGIEELQRDPSWTGTLDTLRRPMKPKEQFYEWRREAPLRPVVFEDPRSLDGEVVHLHLEHRIVQRLLGRFLSQGFLHHELSRACVLRTEDPIPYVVVLGRLSIYGDKAARLHDEILAVAAEWRPAAEKGKKRLKALADEEKAEVLRLVEASLGNDKLRETSDDIRNQFRAATQADVEELRSALERKADRALARASRELAERGAREAKDLRGLLEAQKKNIEKQQKKVESEQLSLFPKEEQKQLEADQRHWAKRLAALSAEIEEAPGKVQRGYEVRTRRVEPVGLVYLWPVSG